MGDESITKTTFIGEHFHNHIYNKKEGKHPFLLQFKQLKHYYNHRKAFKKQLQEDELNPSKNVIQNIFCLIDKKWLKKWKKHVGYKEIKNKIKEDKIERDLDNNDYKWISEIIDKNYIENYLNPLDNITIYKDNEIDPLADFKVIHKDCFKLFNINSKNSSVNTNFRNYPLRYFKEKYIVFLDNEMLFISFKKNNSQNFELIFEFTEIKEKNKENENIKGSKKKIIDILVNKDINEWPKELSIGFNEIEKESDYTNCKIKIYNKVLLRKVEESQIRNSLVPNINGERNELLNTNILAKDLLKAINIQSKANEFYMRDEKPNDNNNNINVVTEMVFDNINEIKKSSNINLENDEQKANNNIMVESNKLNNKTMIALNGNTEAIINKSNRDKIKGNKDNNNDDDQPFNPNNNKEIQNNNSSEFNNKQVNNFINSQNQSFQNQNNNFNSNNQIIYQNGSNNNISNYNIQNQMQFNNNNIIQNNNNQFQNNNNFFMNNNYNNQQNNQLMNLNNVQSNMNQMNIFPSNFNQNMQFNSLQNNQNNNFMANNYQQNFNNFNNYQIMMMLIYQNFLNNLNYINNNNYQNNNKSGKQYPHKSGLQNIGQTCYMNATIECLSNIKEVTDHLLNLNENFISKEKSLTLTYRNLLIELFRSGQKCIVPQVFKSVIGELNPLFQGFHAADSKDLVFFIIERLHLELNNENKNIQNIQKDFYMLELESRNEQLMLQNFFNDFKLKSNSIISETFYGITRSIMECKGCNIKKYSFQSFNMQIFQLKKLKEDKIFHYQNYEKLNLIEGFVLQQIPENLNNENMIYCNNCKGLKDGIHQQNIYQLPKVLIVILNRGRNNADFNEEFDFPAILDLSKTNIALVQNSPRLFYLCGVITHLGESGSGGHFIAYCRNNQNDKFTYYNDSIVSEVSIETALSYKISNNENEKRTPYILFYHYI